MKWRDSFNFAGLALIWHDLLEIIGTVRTLCHATTTQECYVSSTWIA